MKGKAGISQHVDNARRLAGVRDIKMVLDCLGGCEAGCGTVTHVNPAVGEFGVLIPTLLRSTFSLAWIVDPEGYSPEMCFLMAPLLVCFDNEVFF